MRDGHDALRRPGAWALAALLIAASTAAPAMETTRAAIGAQVDALLTRLGLGRDTLSVIGNVIRHEGPPPPAAPALVLELLARPLAAADAATLFDRTVPESLRRLAGVARDGEPEAGGGDTPTPIGDLLAVYLDDLAQAQRVLREAAGDAAIDGTAIVRQFSREALPPTPYRGMPPPVNLALLERASNLFIDATARFAHVLRTRGASVRFPDEVTRFASAVGTVSIGSRGDDHHGPDAAVIIDPGGNDSYQRAPATGGAISVVIDLAGDDRYHGVDLVVHGLSGIVDFAGNDHYAMSGPGLGAAVAGVSVVIDFTGDDTYEARIFGQGAAAYGIGALIDMSGNDTYRLQAAGQGLGLAHGLGLLWDRDGNDTYRVGGVSDVHDRGGGISMAQGAAYGARTWSGGGIGILRDDAGHDLYEAEMFAQGMGYYYGVGLLWDRAGNDHYRAVRYAQGNGVHEAVGILRDDSGDDRYQLTFGVGQGMGLDLAVGVLLDAAGDDRYQSQVVAQGAATANGIGILIDEAGANEWRMGADPRAWGHIGWEGGLPTLGLLLHDPAEATFRREGQRVQPPASGAKVQDSAPAARNSAPDRGCAKVTPDVRRGMTLRLEETLQEIPPDDFDLSWAFSQALRCALTDATPDEAQAIWGGLERRLSAEPAMPLALSVVNALRVHPPPGPQAERMLEALDQHPQCRVRASALFLRHAVGGEPARLTTAASAQAALRSSCWQLQAAGLRVLRALDIVPEDGDHLASFLRGDAVW